MANRETNEQAAARVEAEMLRFKQEYRRQLSDFVQYFGEERHAPEDKRARFVSLHAAATDLFNCGEQSVADTSLLGAHQNEWWARNKAETSLNLLDSALKFHETARAVVGVIGLPGSFAEAGPGAYASMQRMVKRFYPEQAEVFREKFALAKLPTMGFDDPLPNDSAVTATIDIGEGGSLHAEGLSSGDALQIALNRSEVRIGGTSVAGAFRGEEVAAVVDMAAGNKSKTWGTVLRLEAWKAPVQVAVGIFVGVVLLLAGYYGCLQRPVGQHGSPDASARPVSSRP